MTWMEIGLFQLESLSLTPALYLYFDLREEDQAVPPALSPLLKRAQKISAIQVEQHLRESQADSKTPILLICETGATSKALAKRLADKGFEQVYVVAEGVRGLLGEL